MLSGHHGDASMLNVEVQQQVPHDASPIVSLTTSAASASAPTIMDHFKQQQQRLASDRYDEKKEDYPSTNHHHNTSFASSPTKMLSLYSSQNDNGDGHHAYDNSILSSGSMEDDEEDSEDDDDMNVNFIKTTIDDSSFSSPQRSINKAKNHNHTNSPTTTNNNRITLNTYNSILSISDDEDEEGETTTGNIYTLQNNTTKCAPEKTVPDRLPLQVVPCHQRTSPSSCLMDNDDEEDDDDDEDEDSDYEDDDAANAEQRDGSFASLDLGGGGVDANVTTNGCSEHYHAEKQNGYSTKNHQVPLSSSSSSIENNGRSSPTRIASASTTTANNTTPCRPQKATSYSCIPQSPPICTRSWCGGESAATTTTTTPAAVMVVTATSPVLVATTPSIPIPQLPSLATTTDATEQTPPPPLPPPHPCSNTSSSTSQVLMKSPRGGRGFFDTMTEHFVDSLCFPREDDSLQQRTTCSSTIIGVGATAATTTATTTTANSQSPPPQEQCSTPSSGGGGGAAMHTARNLSGSTAATADVIAATDTSTNSTADAPPTRTSINAICGSGGGTSSSSWTSPLFGTTSANTNSSSSSDDQRSLCLHDDIMVLLGCANSPNDDEMQKVWAWNQFILECPQKEDSLFHPVSRVTTCGTPSLQQNYNSHQQYQYHGGRRRPRRRELHERAIRVHQLRTERGMPCYNKKPFLGRTKQMFTRPPVSAAATKMMTSTSSTTTTTTSPTSVTAANSQMDYWSSSSRYQQQQQQEKTHYGNLPMMMDDSNLFAAEYHNSHCSTRRGGADGNNNGDNIMPSSLPLRRSSRSMDDRILQQECKNDPLRKSKLEEHLNRRIGIGKNGSSTTTGPRARAASSILYQEEDEDDIGYDSDPGGLDMYATSTNTTTTTPAASRQQHQNKTQQQRMVETTSGLSTASTTSSSNNSLLGQPSPPAPPPPPLWDANVIEMVQESLNMSWNITWHPGTNFDANGNNNNSRKIRIWIERGTIINSAKVMLEPNIIWRDCYQPEMSKQRKLNVCMQKSSHTQAASASTPGVVKPFTIRLLSVCRVLEAPLHDALDRSLYPLARPSCSFLLKTAAPDGKEYLFEAATTAERDAIVHRWKVCIARFAALAVMEDLDAICREFFVPAISSLVHDDYYHW